nr:retrovirus-related Pol polyprotein from transposon TNT 1-94 [Tanacetum cinerariifolium]
ITSNNVMPRKETTPHSVETQKPEIKVYSRRPKQVKTVRSSKKDKIVESKIANVSKPNHSWGSNATAVPSSFSLVNDRKKYILVIMDDYSQFTWVKFLASKDEAPDFIIKFLKMIQVRLNATVRNIRTDNGIEFVNQTLHSYYESVGISHEASVALEPTLHQMIPATRSSGLVPNPPSPATFVQPSSKEWDLVFQLVFAKFYSPPASVASPDPVVEAHAPIG